VAGFNEITNDFRQGLDAKEAVFMLDSALK
jgi:hypothetical protein